MTPKKFAKQNNVRLSTVNHWIKKQYIDGIKKIDKSNGTEYDIPNSAWRPANFRAKTDIAVRKSFIISTNNRLAINCFICKMSKEEYNARIQQAIKEELIVPYTTSDGTIQYILGTVGQHYIIEKKESILQLAIKAAETTANITEIVKKGLELINLEHIK